MDFSSQDYESLQRAAGLLGLTVDELIAAGRARTSGGSSSNSRPPPASSSARQPLKRPGRRDHHHHRRDAHSVSSSGSSGSGGTIELAGGGGGGGAETRTSSSGSLDSGGLLRDWDLVTTADSARPAGAVVDPSPVPKEPTPVSRSTSSGSIAAMTDQSDDSALHVILLNRASAWYDCNDDFSTMPDEFGQALEALESTDYLSVLEEEGRAAVVEEVHDEDDDAFMPLARGVPLLLDVDAASEAAAASMGLPLGLHHHLPHAHDAASRLPQAPSSRGGSPVPMTPARGPPADDEGSVSPLSQRRPPLYPPLAPKAGSGSGAVAAAVRSGSSSGSGSGGSFEDALRRVSSSSSSGGKIKKKRQPYKLAKRADTNLTRQMNACVRCRMQRNRCIPDPRNPRGPCLTCQSKIARISRLPCLRYKLTDSTLFRTGLDYMAFYKAHPLAGPHHGDFHLEKRWTDATPRFLSLGQDRGVFMQLEIHEFVPPNDPAAVDLKGRSMYIVPWAIADPEAAAAVVNKYVDESIGLYLDAILDDTDGLEWNVFHAAYRASIFPVPNRLLQKVLRLWVACRFIESRWRCWGDDEIDAANPKDPFYDWATPPPYLDYQFASVVIQRVLMPLRRAVLHELQMVVNEHRPEDWYTTFLASFILLHNYELQMQFQKAFADRRQAKVLYLDMPLVRATNSGAKTILAHFHYCCKGQQPFRKDFDWNSQKVQRMAHLDSEQSRFMAAYRDRVQEMGPIFSKVNQTDRYYDKYWYTSQLFDTEWTPRDTLEHAPDATDDGK